MGVKYLLDTNILSELSKEEPDPNVIANLNQHGDTCATSALVIHEINYGIQRLPEGNLKASLQLFLQQLEVYELQVLPYDKQAAHYHASERARLVAKGLTPAFVDGQIAAISVTNDLTLVTRNTKDFENFSEISLDNWFL